MREFDKNITGDTPRPINNNINENKTIKKKKKKKKIQKKDVNLEDMVKHILQKELAKPEKSFDWNKRPIPEIHLHYAALDVYYLVKLAEEMKAKFNDNSSFEKFVQPLSY